MLRGFLCVWVAAMCAACQAYDRGEYFVFAGIGGDGAATTDATPDASTDVPDALHILDVLADTTPGNDVSMPTESGTSHDVIEASATDTGCSGAACDASSCPAGQSRCASGCTNVQSDPDNCSACGVACGAGQMCTNGTCAASTCSGGCQSGSVCSNGMCCPMGTLNCAGSCQSVLFDANNCGACGHPCAAGQVCSWQMCGVPPANDNCAGAIDIPLSSPSTMVTTTVTGATPDVANACYSPGDHGADVYLRFVIPPGPSQIVEADTYGTGWDTLIAFAQGCPNPQVVMPTTGDQITCNDDDCNSDQSWVTAVFTPGTYYVVVGDFVATGPGGSTPVNFRHLPVGNGAVVRVNEGTNNWTAATSGSAVLNPMCGGVAGAGGEDTYWWKRCPGAAPGTMTATTCSAATTFDTLVTYSSVNGGGSCNDDDPLCSVATFASTISTSLDESGNLGTVVVDGTQGTGAYQLRITLP